MSPKLKYHQNFDIAKTEISPKVICNQKGHITNRNVSITEKSLKLKCYQNKSVIKTEMSPKLNVTQT